MTPVAEADLQAYADGLLPEERRAAVEAHLAAHPEDAENVRAWRELNMALRNAYAPVLEEPVPERLRVRRVTAAAPRSALAAGVVALGVALGGMGGWVARGAFEAQPLATAAFPRQAAIAHAVYSPEVRHPVEVGADEEEHLVRWLSKRLGTDLKSPKLGTLGYELVGGRLLTGPMGPVAHFMFQDRRGTRLTLYVSRQRGDPRQTAFRFSQEDKVAVFYWIDGNYGYALSGEMTREALLRVADAVYKQLNP
jgi:anti-sigma factor RsiW